MQQSRCGTASTLHRWAPTLASVSAPRRTPRGLCPGTLRRSRPAFRRRRCCASRRAPVLSLLIKEDVVGRDREARYRCATGRDIAQFRLLSEVTDYHCFVQCHCSDPSGLVSAFAERFNEIVPNTVEGFSCSNFSTTKLLIIGKVTIKNEACGL